TLSVRRRQPERLRLQRARAIQLPPSRDFPAAPDRAATPPRQACGDLRAAPGRSGVFRSAGQEERPRRYLCRQGRDRARAVLGQARTARPARLTVLAQALLRSAALRRLATRSSTRADRRRASAA